MPIIYNIMEMIVILGLFIILMSNTGGSNSSFKYIGSIIVLIVSIQYKREVSFWINIVVCLIILGFNLVEFDYLSLSKNFDIIRNFEGDIILVSSLMITSFILSLYINIENDYNLK